MHPVGPLSPTVYWLRRISAIVAAVAVLIGVVWFLANRSSRSSADGPVAAAAVSSAAPSFTGVLASTTPPSSSTPISPASPSSPAPTSTPAPSPAPTGDPAATVPPPAPETPAPAAATPTPAPASPAVESPAAESPAPESPAAPAAPAAEPGVLATPGAGQGSIGPAAPSAEPAPTPEAPAPPPPSYDAEGRLICADSALSVTAVTDPQLAPGQQANLSMIITNTGTQACRRDVSGTLQVFTVTGADGQRLWSTADCFPGEGTEVRALEPGQQVRYTVKWSGTSSAPGCAGERVPLAPGTYSVIAALGGLASAPAGFTIG